MRRVSFAGLVARFTACALVLGALASSALAEPSGWDELAKSLGGPRDGEIVVDQQPLPTGGPGSDTAFEDDYPEPVWQQAADDILLVETAVIHHLVWWGFYGGNFSGSTDPPTGPETMRVRFYDAKPDDGLPGGTMYEESFLNPSRTATGRIVAANYGDEYTFEVDLTTPFQLDAGTPLWLEIVQVGDLDSTFRWEYSPGDGTPYAFINPYVPDWTQSILTSNVAFQLVTPEPATLLLLALGCVLALKRNGHRTGRRCNAHN